MMEDGTNVATRLLNQLLRGARPLGISWKDFRESQTKEATFVSDKLPESLQG